MLHRHFKSVVVVQEKEVFWLSNLFAESDPSVVAWPLDEFLSSQILVNEIPNSSNGNNKVLCIVPDHWFGTESYPFQAKKQSLINLFLERKLITMFPDRPDIRDFFTYRWSASPDEPGRLQMYFLQERNAFVLYSTLEKLNLTPRLITTPALLWQAKLAELCPDFSRQGTIFIHAYEHECSIYFYSKGNYLFSRNVAVSWKDGQLETLRFEINQSLYMFSQKTKSDVNGYYILADDSINIPLLSGSIGRNFVDLRSEFSSTKLLVCDRVPLVNGLLPPKGISYSQSIIGVTHQKLKRALEWEPAQRIGAVFGVILCALFLAEAMHLHRTLRDQLQDNESLVRQQLFQGTSTLLEYESALDHVLRVKNRPSSEKNIRHIINSFPSSIAMQEVTFSSENENVLTIRASVEAQTPEKLSRVLEQLVTKIRRAVEQANKFSINDIEIQWNPHNNDDSSFQYLIVFQVRV